MNISMRSYRIGLLAASAVLALSGVASALPVFNNAGSRVTITHRGNIFGEPDQVVLGLGGLAAPMADPIPAFPPPAPQFDSTIQGTGPFAPTTSTAKAGVGHLTGPNDAWLNITRSTGVSQSGNVTANAANHSSLRIDFNVNWDIVGQDFGLPLLVGLGGLSLQGTVPENLGAYVYAIAQFDVIGLNAAGQGGPLRLPVNVDFFKNTPGDFQVFLSDLVPANPPLVPAGGLLGVVGFIEFRAHSGFDPAGRSFAGIEMVTDGGMNPAFFPTPGAAGMFGVAGLLAARRRR